ncbi:MAG TPA: glycosyltransferase family 4 protein [Thermoanaerobaculia bacterium]|jgi:glycosyltransferase involved in cell wall biosynthesis
MRVAMLTPLPPARTGVAHYASLLLPALRERVAVDVLEEMRDGYDAYVYQLGNNPHHEWIYDAAVRRPGVVVLHDLVLHHLIVEKTLARGDVKGYVEALRANHGAAGEAWARGRAAGLHSEMGNFLLPASVEIARRATAVIVHNDYARTRLQSFGVTTPIHVVPHPYVPTRGAEEPRSRGAVIGFLGFLTSAKRAHVVLEAFAAARARDPRLELLIVGEPAPDIDLRLLQIDGVTMTGYVSDEEFPKYYARCDRFVNLRYPSAGETSGTLIRALDAGKPVAVSDYAQFAELPDDVVTKIPLGDGEVEALAHFMLAGSVDPARQRAWLESHASLSLAVEGYLRALAPAAQSESAEVRASLPLFPSLTIVSTHPLILRNDGDVTLRTRTYGTPEYRLIARLFDGERVVDDRWLALPCDLEPGASVEIELPLHGRGDRIELRHALQDVPAVDDRPFGVLDGR